MKFSLSVIVLLAATVRGNLFEPAIDNIEKLKNGNPHLTKAVQKIFASSEPFAAEISKNIGPAIHIIEKLENNDPVVTKIVQTILASSQPYIKLFEYIYGKGKLQTNLKEPTNLRDSYDFIVVGAGTAGSVVASRLSEIKSWSVLLIEAGGEETLPMDIPLLALFYQRTEVDWQFRSEPSDKYCRGFKNNQCLMPRGKVLGGSSSINLMFFNRGSPLDYDNWRDLGCEGWGYEDVLKYFKKLETTNVQQRYDPKYRGYNGPVNVEYGAYRPTSLKAFISAGKQAGYPYLDYNGEETCGVSYSQSSTKNGTRDSANRAYLTPASKRKNLDVVKNSLVTKLLFDENGKKVKGVTFISDGKTYTIKSNKEVIMSAGAIKSPQLLMLSGIGPRKHLQELGIKVIQDLPVGHNLYDHVSTPITFRADVSTGVDSVEFATNIISVLGSYVTNHQGPLSLTGIDGVIFTNSTDSSTKAWPDIEILFFDATFSSFDLFKYILNMRDNIYDEVYGNLGHDPGFTIFPILLRPKSTGTLTLRDTKASSNPVIVPNYFEHEEDLDTLIKAIRLTQNIIKQPAMQKINAKLLSDPLTSCLEEGEFDSDKYWKCFIKILTVTIWHYTGTCRMGSETDSRSVVNPRLKVIGVNGLRVVDSSIFPEIPTAHLNVPTYMVAEKASDLIKEDWKIL